MSLLRIIKETLLTEIGDKFELPKNFRILIFNKHGITVEFMVNRHKFFVIFDPLYIENNIYSIGISFGIGNHSFSTLSNINKPYHTVANVVALFDYCMQKYYDEFFYDTYDSLKIQSFYYQPVFKSTEKDLKIDLVNNLPINTRDLLFREFIKKYSSKFGSKVTFVKNDKFSEVVAEFRPYLEIK